MNRSDDFLTYSTFSQFYNLLNIFAAFYAETVKFMSNTNKKTVVQSQLKMKTTHL